MSEAVMKPPQVNRREVLWIGWAASMALATAGSTGAILWFAYPIPRAGEIGFPFPVPLTDIPPANAAPSGKYVTGRFWLSHTDKGVSALYMVCVHLGCLYKWVPANNRFECPCHGSKYHLDGTYIEGPAPRNLDRFVIDAVDAGGKVLASTTKGDANADPSIGGPLALPDGTASIIVKTAEKVKGKNHA